MLLGDVRRLRRSERRRARLPAMRSSGCLAPRPCRFLAAIGDELFFHHLSSFATRPPEQKFGTTRGRVSSAPIALTFVACSKFLSVIVLALADCPPRSWKVDLLAMTSGLSSTKSPGAHLHSETRTAKNTLLLLLTKPRSVSNQCHVHLCAFPSNRAPTTQALETSGSSSSRVAFRNIHVEAFTDTPPSILCSVPQRLTFETTTHQEFDPCSPVVERASLCVPSATTCSCEQSAPFVLKKP